MIPSLKPIKRPDLIRRLRDFGFEGLYSGGNHQYMMQDQLKLFIPNPHRGEISAELLARLLLQAGIDRDKWEP